MSKKEDKTIGRREATKKMGKYAALTAASTFILLNSKKAQAFSPTQISGGPGNTPWDNGNG